MSTTGTRLQCGTRVSDLAALLDIDHGAGDALPPARAARVREHAHHCPYCSGSLASLRSLYTSAQTVLDEQAQAEAGPAWVDQILSGLALEMRAGRSIPLTPPTQPDLVEQTEGSLRSLLRQALAAEDSFVLRTAFEGELTTFGSPIRVTLTLQTALGAAIPRVAARVRSRCIQLIEQSTRLHVESVDIIVADIFTPDTPAKATA